MIFSPSLDFLMRSMEPKMGTNKAESPMIKARDITMGDYRSYFFTILLRRNKPPIELKAQKEPIHNPNLMFRVL